MYDLHTLGPAILSISVERNFVPFDIWKRLKVPLKEVHVIGLGGKLANEASIAIVLCNFLECHQVAVLAKVTTEFGHALGIRILCIELGYDLIRERKAFGVLLRLGCHD